jgi:hypothetical protein
MSTLNRRRYIDFIYGEVYNQDFTDYELAPYVDVDVLFMTVNDLVADFVTGTGPSQLANYLPTGVYVPSEAMKADAEKAKEEIDRLKQQLEEAERLFRVALINKAPFRRVDGCDDYGDDNEDDGNSNGNNDCLPVCLV